MSHTTSRLRASAGVVALAALSLAAPTANAATQTINLSCKFPIVGSTNLRVTYDLKPSVVVDKVTTASTVTSVQFTAPVLDWGAKATGTGTFNATLSKGDFSIPTITKFNYPLIEPADGPSWIPEERGEWKFIVQGATLNLAIVDASGNPVRYPTGPAEEDSDGNPDTTDLRCTPPVVPGGPVSPSIFVTDVDDDFGPTIPGQVVVGNVTDTTAQLNWTASTDDKGIAAYDVFLDGAKVGSVPGTQTTFKLTGLVRNTEYQVGVRAVDTDGNTSQAGTSFFTTGHVDRFGIPSGVEAVQTASSVALTWDVTGGFEPPAYGVIVDGKLVKTVTEKRAIVPLAPGFTYSVQVASLDGTAEIGRSAPILVKIDGPEPTEQNGSYDVTGSASIKTLARGTVALKGGLQIAADVAGNVSGSLNLAPASTRLVVAGVFPVTAKVAFVPSGGLTGTYKPNGAISANAKVRIKVTEAKLFGAIPLVTGNTCQTRSLTDLALGSDDFGFDGDDTLTGTFAMSNLNGCGLLNGVLSPATAGGGNTITLKTSLTPPPAQNT